MASEVRWKVVVENIDNRSDARALAKIIRENGGITDIRVDVQGYIVDSIEGE